MYSSAQQEKQQKNAQADAAGAVRAAQQKSAEVPGQAAAEAERKVTNRRRSMSETILTSPLGLSEKAPTETRTLLGG